jgi:hypothetical protein
MQRRRIPWTWWCSWLLTLAVMVSANPATAEQPIPPLPPPRPDRPTASSGDEDKQANPAAESQTTKKPADSTPGEGCPARLTKLGVRFETKQPIQENACTVVDPVLVSALPGEVALSPPAVMACQTAEGLVRWVQDVLTPESQRHLKNMPTKILIGTSYQCRDQRNGEKLSAHALGEAVDIMGFGIAERSPFSIGFQAAGSPEELFQSAIQKGACAIFTTVLGPGADADHGNHLHLDMRVRKAGYRICQ